jgi:hypothetical protein
MESSFLPKRSKCERTIQIWTKFYEITVDYPRNESHDDLAHMMENIQFRNVSSPFLDNGTML